MSNQLREAEMHCTTVRVAEPLTIPFHLKWQIHSAIAPSVAEFVWRDGDWGKAGGRLGMQETKASLHFSRPENAKADIVYLQNKLDVFTSLLCRATQRNIIH
ncbi:hypothetical protein D3C87_1886740 [compost metagenome]